MTVKLKLAPFFKIISLLLLVPILFSCISHNAPAVSVITGAPADDEPPGDVPRLTETSVTEIETAPATETSAVTDGTVTDIGTAVSKSETSASESAPDYIVVPRFYDLDETAAKTLMSGYGITCSCEYEYSDSHKGNVYSVEFKGYWDDDNLYITPGCVVSLKVSLGQAPAEQVTGSGKTVYLTFDDGPTKENTYRILEILDKHNIKATFFVVGYCAEKYNDQLKAIYEAGHAVGCHSYSHVLDTLYGSSDSFAQDLSRWEKTVYAVIGELDYKLFRFPAGSARARSYSDTYGKIRETLEASGYRAFDWTMTNNDVWSGTKSGGLTAEEYEKQSLSTQLQTLEGWGTYPKIILMHETYDSTVDMLEWAIELLTQKGYSFDTLDHYDGSYFQ